MTTIPSTYCTHDPDCTGFPELCSSCSLGYPKIEVKKEEDESQSGLHLTK
jgi:hypothetical protein